MTIDSEQELQYAYEDIARMYKLCETIAADTTGIPETREDQIEGVKAMIRKIERQIGAYYAAHSNEERQPASVA